MYYCFLVYDNCNRVVLRTSHGDKLFKFLLDNAAKELFVHEVCA